MVVKNDFAKVSADVHDAVAEEVRLISLDLLAQSVALAPLEDGLLKGSGSAHWNGERIATGSDVDPQATGGLAAVGGQGSDELTGLVMFSAPYSIAQHEKTDYAHASGGQAKYLEQPLETNRSQYQKRFVDAVATEVK